MSLINGSVLDYQNFGGICANIDTQAGSAALATATPLPTPLTIASRDADANTCFNNMIASVETAPLGPFVATLSLTPTNAWRQRITDAGYSAVGMPIATTVLYVGQSWKLINDKGDRQSLNVVDSASNILGVIPGSSSGESGCAVLVTCLDNTTGAGVWEVEHIANAKFTDNGSFTHAALSGGNQTIVSGAAAAIIKFDSYDQFCPSIFYNIATGIALVNETGRYEICAHVEHSGYGAASVPVAVSSLNLNVCVGGAPQFYAVTERSIGYSNRKSLTTRGVLQCTAGNQITITTFQDGLDGAGVGVNTFIGFHNVAPTTARFGCSLQIRRVQ